VLCSLADDQVARREGVYRHPSLEAEGFLHASPWPQLSRVAHKYYGHISELVVLVVEVARVHPEIKWEPAAGSLYPHIYGPLNMDAVVRTLPVAKTPEGRFMFAPEDPG